MLKSAIGETRLDPITQSGGVEGGEPEQGCIEMLPRLLRAQLLADPLYVGESGRCGYQFGSSVR
jgi:hypothetical protein